MIPCRIHCVLLYFTVAILVIAFDSPFWPHFVHIKASIQLYKEFQFQGLVGGLASTRLLSLETSLWTTEAQAPILQATSLL